MVNEEIRIKLRADMSELDNQANIAKEKGEAVRAGYDKIHTQLRFNLLQTKMVLWAIFRQFQDQRWAQIAMQTIEIGTMADMIRRYKIQATAHFATGNIYGGVALTAAGIAMIGLKGTAIARREQMRQQAIKDAARRESIQSINDMIRSYNTGG